MATTRSDSRSTDVDLFPYVDGYHIPGVDSTGICVSIRSRRQEMKVLALNTLMESLRFATEIGMLPLA